eukprot:1407327-Rhodomonas_salina.1
MVAASTCRTSSRMLTAGMRGTAIIVESYLYTKRRLEDEVRHRPIARRPGSWSLELEVLVSCIRSDDWLKRFGSDSWLSLACLVGMMEAE